MSSRVSGLPRDPTADRCGIGASGLRPGLGSVVSLQHGAVRQPGAALGLQPETRLPQVTHTCAAPPAAAGLADLLWLLTGAVGSSLPTAS